MWWQAPDWAQIDSIYGHVWRKTFKGQTGDAIFILPPDPIPSKRATRCLTRSLEVTRIPPLLPVWRDTGAVNEKRMAARLNDSYKPLDFSASVLSNYMRVGDVWIPCRFIFDDEFVAPESSGPGFLIKQNFGGLTRRVNGFVHACHHHASKSADFALVTLGGLGEFVDA